MIFAHAISSFRTALLLFLCIAAPLAQAALTVNVSTPIDVARQGEFVPIEILVTNTDGFSRPGVGIEMATPAELNQIFETDMDGDCPSTTCTEGETIVWTLGTIPAGGAVSVTLPVYVSLGANDGATISFAATVEDDLLDTDTDSADVVVDVDVNYDITLAEQSDPSTAGSQLTYKLSYGYRADAASVSLSTLRFPIPANTTFVSATGGGAPGGGNVDWALGILSPGDGGVREVTVELDAGLSAADVIAASAEIFANLSPTDNAISQTTTAIAPAGGLKLVVESNTNPSRPTELLNLDLTVTNTDPFTQFGVTLVGYTPSDLEQIFETYFDGDCGATTCTDGERMTFLLGDIPAGQSVTVGIPPFVRNVATGGVLLNMPMTATDALGRQTRLTETIRVQDDTLYDLSVAEDSDPATAGSTMTYRLTYGYRQDAASVNNSILRMPLPSGTSFVSATDGGSVVGGAVQWALGILQPGDSGIREATVQLSGGLSASDVIEAAAEISSVTATAEVARAEANTVIAAASGLQLAIESNANPARPFELVNFEFTVTNTDVFPRFGVQIIGVVGEDMFQTFETAFDGDCNSTTCTAGERLVFTLGQINAGETITVPMPPSVSNIATPGELIKYYMTAVDDQGIQTRQLETLRVQDDTIYDLSLSEGRDPATAGSNLDYKLSWTHRADAAAVSETLLRMPLPAGTTFVSATDGGNLLAGTVQWSLGFLAPGDNGIREATLALDGGLANGTVVEAFAELSSASSPADRARSEAHTIVASSTPLSLSIETNPEPARIDEQGELVFSVTNNDPFTRFGVTLTGYFPEGYSQTFESDMDGDCGSTTCSTGERITWNLGDIASGDSKTVGMQVDVAAAAPDGVLIPMYARASDDQGDETRQADAVRTQADTIYDVAIYEDADPAAPGDTLTYKLTYGYRQDAAAVNDSRLRLSLPDGVTFLSSTGGGVLNGDVVDWNLGFLSPGDQGIRQATVMIDGGTAPGSILEATVDLYAFATPDEGARSEANTIVRATVPLSLQIDPIVFTAVGNRTINSKITVTNNDAFTRFGVTLQGRYPQNLLQYFESSPEFTGDCGSTTCSATERITWPLVDLAPGESVTVDFAPTVAAPTVDGRLINILAWVEDDQGTQARAGEAYATGCIEELDADCDGILDSNDNCLGLANTDQRDTDGDNIGNRCDADIRVPNDCNVNPLDLGVFKAAFFGTPGDGNWNPDADFNGDAVTNAIDLGIMKSLFFQVPGPSALANACAP